MSEDQKQALIGLCKIEIKRWKAASESDPNMRYMVELMGVALSALTAEPVADVVSWNHPVENRTCAVQLRRFDLLPGELFTAPPAPAADLADLLPDVEKWRSPEAVRAQMAYRNLVEKAIATEAAVPVAAHDGWRLVPMEPTKEMIVAGQDKFEECIDSGFDSCEDGSTYEYSKISSDAPYLVYIAMLAAAPEVE